MLCVKVVANPRTWVSMWKMPRPAVHSCLALAGSLASLASPRLAFVMPCLPPWRPFPLAILAMASYPSPSG